MTAAPVTRLQAWADDRPPSLMPHAEDVHDVLAVLAAVDTLAAAWEHADDTGYTLEYCAAQLRKALRGTG